MLKLYYTLVFPYLSYCSLIWANSAITNLTPIVTAQKKIVRIIHFMPFNSHTNPLFHQSKILKLFDIYNYFLGVYMYIHGDNVVFQSHSHIYATRNRSNLVPNYYRLNTS